MKLFITGTDTGVGKTYVTAGLLKFFSQQGYQTLGLKPVASGSQLIGGKYCNEDALALQANSSLALSYEQVNPFPLIEPVSPHIAAKYQGLCLSAQQIYEACLPALNVSSADMLLVEGVGGWAVPINKQETMMDFAKCLNFPVILVVGLRLGCLNHARLTYEAIERSGLPLLGWIANQLDPMMLAIEENIETLQHYFKSPYLGHLQVGEEVGAAIAKKLEAVYHGFAT